MKFFLLSLVVNIILLLLPLKSNTLEQKSEKKIVVTLNLKEKKVAPLPKPKPPKKVKKRIKVKKIAKKPKKVAKKIVKKTKPKKVAKKPKKKIKPQPKTADLKTTNTPTKPLHVKNTKDTPSSPKTTHNPSKQNAQTKQEPKKEFCKKGVDFVVTKKPRLNYPRRAKRLRINKTVHVDVYFKVQSGGGIVILGAKGGNKLFQNEAKKRTKSIKIKLLNKQAIHCKIIQPFRFEP